MTRLLLIIAFFLLSLLCILKAPEYNLWHVSVLVSESSWIFFILTCLLLLWGFKARQYGLPGTLIGLLAGVLYLVPLIGAYSMGSTLTADMNNAFSTAGDGSEQLNIFSATRMVKCTRLVPFIKIPYTAGADGPLTLDFYNGNGGGNRPCVIVVHGGSWSAGDSRQLPELNSVLAMHGYHVVSINYRLAPKYISPAPVEDLRAAITYLRTHATALAIDTGNFVLLGRSAGGQIALTTAYTMHDTSIKGVINFYGPADMVWGYAHPANPLVLNTCKVMEDYLGGSYAQVPQQYVLSSATATSSAIPTLTIHGKNDPLVAYEHSTRLENKLNELGVKHYLLSLPWATHGCDYFLNGPSGQLSTFAVLRFLDIVTKGK